MSSPEPRGATVGDELEVKLVQGIAGFDPTSWDACVGADQPCLSHAFLLALEESGSACRETGWLPVHLALEAGGRLLGCAPMYLKSHSYGEYVFDWGWANAYERAGGSYYPKLQVAVPFTPVPGPRLLTRPGAGDEVRGVLARGLIGAAEQLGVSSLHVTFCPEAERRCLAAAGLLERQGVQYHWRNRGYRSFDDFLGALKSSRRKTIRKERARIVEQGLSLEILTGAALTPAIWDQFYPFYRATVDKRWGGAYLRKRFFYRLGETMAEQVVLVMARHGGRYVAGALNLLGGETLYGRVWGCRRGVRIPALRGLLLSGDRVRDRPRPRAGRGGCAGAAQAAARLRARCDPQRALDPRPRLSRCRRALSEGGTLRDGRRSGAPGRHAALPPGFLGPAVAGLQTPVDHARGADSQGRMDHAVPVADNG